MQKKNNRRSFRFAMRSIRMTAVWVRLAYQDNRMALRATLLKLSLQSRPGDAVVAVLVEGSEAVFKLFPLRGGERKMVVFQAVPELRDQGKALRRGQTLKLVSGE